MVREMGLFDDKTITMNDISDIPQKQILPFIVGRQIDRILASSGSLYNQSNFSGLVSNLKNMQTQLRFLAKFLEPYLRRNILEANGLKEKLNLPAPSSMSELDAFVIELSEAFGEIVDNLGRVGMLPPVERELESGSD